MTEKQTEALEKLNRGVQDSRKEVQQRTMSLAQEYFGDSAEALKQQINENRAALEGLPGQVPGGREEAFQTLFQELMDNYSAMEQCINDARKDVADLDTDQIRRQGEVEATDAARREAREMGVDLTQVEGTGSEGRVTVDDVKKFAQALEEGDAGGPAQRAQGAAEQMQQAAGQATDQAQQVAQGAQDVVGQAAGQIGQITDQADRAAEEIDASDAAKREAKARGIDLSKVEGTGADGRIVYWDVVDPVSEAEAGAGPAGQAQEAGQATGQTGQVASQARQVAGGAAQQAQDAVGGLAGGEGDEEGGGPLGGVTDQAQQVAGQATEQAGQVAGQAQDTAGQAAQQGQQVAGQATDQAGQAAGQAQEAAGQATEQAGQAAGQAQEAASGAAQQAQDTAGQATEQAQGAASGNQAEGPRITNAARRKAEEMGVDLSTIQGTGSGGLITIKDVTGS